MGCFGRAETVTVAVAIESGTKSSDLADVYSAIGEWFLYPEQIDQDLVTDEAVERVASAAGRITPEVENGIRAFHEGREAVTIEEYLCLLELNPQCPLYLGSYQFQEPTTCSSAGVSERNRYMLEIANVYRHFGFEMSGELPDFLPAIADFLAITVGCEGKERELRDAFIDRLVLPGVEPFAEKLGGLDTPYSRLAEAFVTCLRSEVPEGTETTPPGPGPGEGERPIKIWKRNPNE